MYILSGYLPDVLHFNSQNPHLLDMQCESFGDAVQGTRWEKAGIEECRKIPDTLIIHLPSPAVK